MGETAAVRVVVSLPSAGASAWGKLHRGANVTIFDEAEMAHAQAAGRDLAARGPIGLVLGGGGAKGAYQVGCWKALRDCGVAQFGAIAGTSVGALNAVLVAQDEFAKAESLWHDMRFGRVLRLQWRVVLAVLLRIVLVVPWLGGRVFPARVIPVAWWRAMQTFRQGQREGEPQLQFLAALRFYAVFLSKPHSGEIVSWIVLGAVMIAGLSAWWVLAAPVLTVAAIVVVGPLVAFWLLAYGSWLALMLDRLSTRLAVASNEPLRQLVRDCVDVARLSALAQPLLVTLASLGEVTRMELQWHTKPVSPQPDAPDTAATPSWWTKNITGSQLDYVPSVRVREPTPVTRIRYVPSYFDVRSRNDLQELILQSAALPEIFPARWIGDKPYVDGGTGDNVPLAALAGVPGHATIIVVPLSNDEATVRDKIAENLERLGTTASAAPPELVFLTPSRSLGNFLTGTLNFRAVRARALMQQGYGDTIRHLARRLDPHRGQI